MENTPELDGIADFDELEALFGQDDSESGGLRQLLPGLGPAPAEARITHFLFPGKAASPYPFTDTGMRLCLFIQYPRQSGACRST